MGIGGISIWQLIILLFGTKKLGSLGSDLGSALRGFKSGMKDLDQQNSENDEPKSTSTAINTESQSVQITPNSINNRV